MFLHSRRRGGRDRQLLTDVNGYIDMRRSSNKCKMSSSFRYVFLPRQRLMASVHDGGHDRLTMVRSKQRNLNNAFAYDLVPSPSVLIAALKAARRVNDFPTAVRIFEGTCFQILGTGTRHA